MRTFIAALVIAGLAIGVFLLWPRSTADDPLVNLAEASTTTSTSTTLAATTTTPIPSTSTSTTLATPDSHIVETTAEAEEILRELWFGWFEGIYNQDEERIREVVSTEHFLSSGLAAFGNLEFATRPTDTGLKFDELEILEASSDCLAVWSKTETNFLETTEPRTGVDILRRTEEGWKFASSWSFRDDLWEADCESELLPLP